MVGINKIKVLGIALTIMGFLPTIYWAVNFVQSRAVRSTDILWGAPIAGIGACLLAMNEGRSSVNDK